jgi:molecular chaperone GrpE (heat shock protein)
MAGGLEKDHDEGMNRDEILRRFEAFLDASLADEEPPRGIDAELLQRIEIGGEAGAEEPEQYDSYALWAAMTALTQEVKLQGRTFKELSDAVVSQAGRIAEELRAVYREREREVQREAERRSRKEILGGLIDLRDRLGRGLESTAAAMEVVKAGQTNWLSRMLRNAPDVSASSTLAALMRGYELGVERLDHMLEEFDASEIPCRGQRFDPHRMNAIELEESSAVPDGTVLEVYRSGYEWNGEVFRPAQVKVSRAPGSGESA